MPIETRIRKKRRLTIVQSTSDGIDIVAGTGFDTESGRMMLVLSELAQPLLVPRVNSKLSMTLQQLQEQGNSVVIFLRDAHTCDALIERLQLMQQIIRTGEIHQNTKQLIAVS